MWQERQEKRDFSFYNCSCRSTR